MPRSSTKRKPMKRPGITSRPGLCEEDEDEEGFEEASSLTESATGMRSSRSRSLSLVAITIVDDLSSPIGSRRPYPPKQTNRTRRRSGPSTLCARACVSRRKIKSNPTPWNLKRVTFVFVILFFGFAISLSFSMIWNLFFFLFFHFFIKICFWWGQMGYKVFEGVE